MSFRTGIVFTLLFGCTIVVSGQQFFFQHRADIGLPSQECYNIMQDSRGYIWISTDEGLCRYNGHQLKVLGKKEGLSELSCYCVKENSQGDIWMITSANRFLTYRNDSLYESPFTRKYKEKFDRKLHQLYRFDVVDTSVFFHSQYNTYRADLNGNLVAITTFDTNANYSFVRTNNNLLPIKKEKAPREIPKQLKILIKHKNEIQSFIVPHALKNYPDWRRCSEISNNGIAFLSLDDKVVVVYPDKNIKILYFPNRVLNIYCDKDDGLWIGIYKNGVYYYPDLMKSEYHIIGLSDLSVSGVCEDHEKGIWCTTLERGVFYSGNKSIISYNNLIGFDKTVEMLKVIDGKIWVSSVAGQLDVYDGKVLNRISFGSDYSYPLSDIVKMEDGYVIAGKQLLIKADEHLSSFLEIGVKHPFKRKGGIQAILGPEGRIFTIYQGGINEIIRMRASEYVNTDFGATSIHYRKNNCLWAGTKHELYTISLTDLSTKKINGINDHVIKIMDGPGGEVWIITRHSGIFIMRNGNVYNLNEFFILPTDRFYDMVMDCNQVIWIGSNKGLIRIKRTSENPELGLYTSSNGLPSDEIYKLALDSQRLYFSTMAGIASIPLNIELKNIKAPRIFVRSVQANEVPIDIHFGQLITLPYHQNSLKIEVDVLSFKQSSSKKIIYVLKGPGEKHHYDRTDEIILGNLDPGTYTLSIFGINNDEKMSVDPVVLNFRIHPPFWQSYWFIVSSVLLLLILIFLIINRTIFRIRKKEREKTRINQLIAEYQLTALQAQMNPHFIFNAINSIQTYILANQPQEAYDYLAKFAKLIRLVLNHAKDKSLSLENELEILSTYIKLEQIRFVDKFNFELIVDPLINQYEVEIPPMLIQPYVENALWHGLLPLKNLRKGTLKIEIQKMKNSLLVIIEDNGVGREYSKNNQKPGKYPSMGMILTKQRMELLRNSNYPDAKIEVIDLYKDDQPVGTRIEINISEFY